MHALELVGLDWFGFQLNLASVPWLQFLLVLWLPCDWCFDFFVVFVCGISFNGHRSENKNYIAINQKSHILGSEIANKNKVHIMCSEAMLNFKVASLCNENPFTWRIMDPFQMAYILYIYR